MHNSRSWLRTLVLPKHLLRTVLLAIAVGTWLTAVNLHDIILSGSWDFRLVGKILLNYLTPFVVANMGLLSHAGHPD